MRTGELDFNSLAEVEDSDVKMYHNGNTRNRASHKSKISGRERRFIAWDGEGMNLLGEDKPQRYVLFGCSTGDFISGQNLGFFQICDFIIEVGIKYPTAFHVGFSFRYDTNMITRTLSETSILKLYRKGSLSLTWNGHRYTLISRPGKWLSITRYHTTQYDKNNKVTVKIDDIFGFFVCSFVDACQKLLGSSEELTKVLEGKKLRACFDDMEYVKQYWKLEIELLEKLATKFRDLVYSAGLPIRDWYGPGALASYAMSRNHIKEHKAECPIEVKTASRYAYAGGRFELFHVGNYQDGVFGIDINSAYPHGISQLPSLAGGTWEHVISPDSIEKFAVYRIRLNRKMGFVKPPSPLFHRDERGNISYPWRVEGWYWGPEANILINDPQTDVMEGWVFTPKTDRKPFDWINETYNQRRQWKQKGIAAEYALKLLMNSLYGKMAQRVGWDEKTRRIPPWHQLEWAGWVTSNTRAALYNVMHKIPYGSLISVETDGIFTTVNPESLGIISSKELGKWEITEYAQIIYLQSGLAIMREPNGAWKIKTRGFDRSNPTANIDGLKAAEIADFCKRLEAGGKWPEFEGMTTRFIGYGAAVATSGTIGFKNRHCRWERQHKSLKIGAKGKRVHVALVCDACRNGYNALEMPHDLVICSRGNRTSTPHHIPWENDGTEIPEWREYEDEHFDEILCEM